mmetsp:Transcript_20815/g.52701  ORF Transcript_20815/g.52701 Transcript_20815/m.52701 type:complete len:260 (+) Transcript_20815:1874-2653(+)
MTDPTRPASAVNSSSVRPKRGLARSPTTACTRAACASHQRWCASRLALRRCMPASRVAPRTRQCTCRVGCEDSRCARMNAPRKPVAPVRNTEFRATASDCASNAARCSSLATMAGSRRASAARSTGAASSGAAVVCSDTSSRRRMAEEMSFTVGQRKRMSSGMSILNVWRSWKMRRVARMEWPPMSKKLSVWVKSARPSTSCHTCSTAFSCGVMASLGTSEPTRWRERKVSGKGRAFLSTLPLGVSGMRLRGTNTDGML